MYIFDVAIENIRLKNQKRNLGIEEVLKHEYRKLG